MFAFCSTTAAWRLQAEKCADVLGNKIELEDEGMDDAPFIEEQQEGDEDVPYLSLRLHGY
jgi:hypothetical protein